MFSSTMVLSHTNSYAVRLHDVIRQEKKRKKNFFFLRENVSSPFYTCVEAQRTLKSYFNKSCGSAHLLSAAVKNHSWNYWCIIHISIALNKCHLMDFSCKRFESGSLLTKKKRITKLKKGWNRLHFELARKIIHLTDDDVLRLIQLCYCILKKSLKRVT